jgi:hypothetical protein
LSVGAFAVCAVEVVDAVEAVAAVAVFVGFVPPTPDGAAYAVLALGIAVTRLRPVVAAVVVVVVVVPDGDAGVADDESGVLADEAVFVAVVVVVPDGEAIVSDGEGGVLTGEAVFVVVVLVVVPDGDGGVGGVLTGEAVFVVVVLVVPDGDADVADAESSVLAGEAVVVVAVELEAELVGGGRVPACCLRRMADLSAARSSVLDVVAPGVGGVVLSLIKPSLLLSPWPRPYR